MRLQLLLKLWGRPARQERADFLTRTETNGEAATARRCDPLFTVNFSRPRSPVGADVRFHVHRAIASKVNWRKERAEQLQQQGRASATQYRRETQAQSKHTRREAPRTRQGNGKTNQPKPARDQLPHPQRTSRFQPRQLPWFLSGTRPR